MKYRQSNVLIWFLDADLQKSAEYLCDVALDKTVEGCFCALSCAILYFAGIRTKKVHEYLFAKERKAETVDRLFQGWPFVSPPQMKYWTSRACRWARQCGEYFDYAKRYFDILLQEYEYRRRRRHRRAALSEWIDCDMRTKIPAAGVKTVALPWKSLKQKFRRRDVIEGYRLQYDDTFVMGDPVQAYLTSARDIPEFLSRKYGLETSSMIT